MCETDHRVTEDTGLPLALPLLNILSTAAAADTIHHMRHLLAHLMAMDSKVILAILARGV